MSAPHYLPDLLVVVRPVGAPRPTNATVVACPPDYTGPAGWASLASEALAKLGIERPRGSLAAAYEWAVQFYRVGLGADGAVRPEESALVRVSAPVAG